MTWFLIGFLLGSPLTDHFASREACEGRAVVLREKGFAGRCVPADDPAQSTLRCSSWSCSLDPGSATQITPYVSPR